MWYHFLHQGKNLCLNPFSHWGPGFKYQRYRCPVFTRCTFFTRPDPTYSEEEKQSDFGPELHSCTFYRARAPCATWTSRVIISLGAWTGAWARLMGTLEPTTKSPFGALGTASARTLAALWGTWPPWTSARAAATTPAALRLEICVSGDIEGQRVRSLETRGLVLLRNN